MRRFTIEMEENGYGIFDTIRRAFVIEGIANFGVACELHEMLSGECASA
ncbi:MAG: hypothetical protein HQL50_15390 [Magnetococcales bacterium]|nr:hypothetical protein [Magnetococcales bacterium]